MLLLEVDGDCIEVDDPEQPRVVQQNDSDIISIRILRNIKIFIFVCFDNFDCRTLLTSIIYENYDLQPRECNILFDFNDV